MQDMKSSLLLRGMLTVNDTNKIVMLDSITNKLLKYDSNSAEYILYFELCCWDGFYNLDIYEKSAVLECAVILFNRINNVFHNRLMSIQGVASFIGMQLDDCDDGLSRIVDLRDIETPQDRRDAIMYACEKWVADMDW